MTIVIVRRRRRRRKPEEIDRGPETHRGKGTSAAAPRRACEGELMTGTGRPTEGPTATAISRPSHDFSPPPSPPAIASGWKRKRNAQSAGATD